MKLDEIVNHVGEPMLGALGVLDWTAAGPAMASVVCPRDGAARADAAHQPQAPREGSCETTSWLPP